MALQFGDSRHLEFLKSVVTFEPLNQFSEYLTGKKHRLWYCLLMINTLTWFSRKLTRADGPGFDSPGSDREPFQRTFNDLICESLNLREYRYPYRGLTYCKISKQ